MTQKEKQLLFQELCTRLPYNTYITIKSDGIDGLQWDNVLLTPLILHQIIAKDAIEYIKLYLRPISSMTKKEHEEEPVGTSLDDYMSADEAGDFVDWLLEHHFDYKGLIEKGLALEEPEGMYKAE